MDRASRAFTSLVAHRRVTLEFGLLAIAIAVILGAFHAVAPGHGKTVMAAYLVGQRGTLRQAAIIGLTVTATHTAGVLGLGIVLTTSTIIAPERLYPWLGLASGLLVASIGVSMLRRARHTRRLFAGVTASADHDNAPHHHDHDLHGHHHDGDSVHRHGGHAHTHAVPDPDRPISTKALVAMGFAGGLVPSPSALVVLLGAIALGRAWFGLLLVLAYGLGMAVTLTGAGLLLVRARRFLDRRAERHAGRLARLAYLLPAATAIVIVTVGLVLALRGVAKI